MWKGHLQPYEQHPCRRPAWAIIGAGMLGVGVQQVNGREVGDVQRILGDKSRCHSQRVLSEIATMKCHPAAASG